MSPSVPVKVALTGGIATGKSRCLARFAALGAPVIDADVLARQAVAPGTPGLAAVAARFGRDALRRNGQLDREALARVVFADPAARAALEAIVHPAVYLAIEAWFERLAAAGAPAGIADVPLLFETGHEREFDRTLVTSCRPDQQISRLVARGLSAADAAARLAAQWPTDRKAARADVVIDTSGTLQETDRQVDEIWRRLAKRP